MSKLIYLDNAATTFPKPQIVNDTVDYINRNLAVNSGRGSYGLSRKANAIINETREGIANLLNINNPNKVIFTPSATIAINQIINGIEWENIRVVYVSPFEHNAIMRGLEMKRKEYDFKLEIIPFDSNTLELNQKKLEILISKNKADLIMISHVSNTTGYILPIKQILDIARNNQTITVIDGSQSIGLVELVEKRYDFLIFAGHKTLYSPFGIGGFIKNSNIYLKETLVGGTGSDSTNLEMPKELPYKYESGSYNIQAIAGLNAGIKWIEKNNIKHILEKEQHLTQYLVKELDDIEEIELYIPKDKAKHVGIVSFNVDGFNAAEFADILDEEFNIAVRAGHHCAPLIGVFLKGQAEAGTIRVSLSFFNTEQEITELKTAIIDIIRG